MSTAPTRQLAGTVLLLLATLMATRLTAHRKMEALSRPLSAIPLDLGGFRGSDEPPLADAVLHELRASSYLARNYVKSDVSTELFIAYYAQQRAGESMHSPKHCLPGGGWEIWNYGTATVSVKGRPIEVNKYSIRREGTRAVVLYWYQSKERIIASEYAGKILLARDALLQNSTAAAIVRIVVPDTPRGVEMATDLASQVIPEVQKCYPN